LPRRPAVLAARGVSSSRIFAKIRQLSIGIKLA